MTNCACGNTKNYMECCELIHKNIDKATTAEELMRSRYTAYTVADIAYLMKSHHSTTRPIKEKKEILRWAKTMHWIRLEVLACTKGSCNDIEGTVAFKAFYHDGTQVQMLHENSKFIRENGYWVYLGEV